MTETAVSVEQCSSCENIIKESTASIACSLCLSWFHKGCTGLSTKDFNKYSTDWKKNRKHGWTCDECKARKPALGEPRRSINPASTYSTQSSTDVDTRENNSRKQIRNRGTGSTARQIMNTEADIELVNNLTSNPDQDLSAILTKNKSTITLSDAISAIGHLHQVILQQNITMHSILNEMKSLKAYEGRLDTLEMDIKNIRNELTLFKSTAHPSTIATDHSGSNLGNADLVSDSVREISERQKRQRNIMIFGAEEAAAENNLNRAEFDTLAATNIIEATFPEATLENIKVFRVGRENPSKPRPLKIIMNSATEVTNIIRHANELRNVEAYRHIRLSYDRTPKQIQEYQALKATLKSRIDNGELGLKIKYVNGSPKIVKHLN